MNREYEKNQDLEAEKLSDHVMMFSGISMCDSPMNTDEKAVEFWCFL